MKKMTKIQLDALRTYTSLPTAFMDATAFEVTEIVQDLLDHVRMLEHNIAKLEADLKYERDVTQLDNSD